MTKPSQHSLDLAGKNVVVVGFQRTGAAVAEFLARRGARVTVTDMAGERELASYVERIRNFRAGKQIRLELGGHKLETFEKADLMIISPGVPHTIAPVQRALAANIPLMGEMELAGRFIEEPILAITGTNGKTTTTELVGAMLTASGIPNFVGGNIGNPLIEYLDLPEKVRVVVAEVSSFQLDTTSTFRPKAGVLLNITDDHLDRYGDMQAYALSKSMVFAHQEMTDIAIFNARDLKTYPFLLEVKSRKMVFNLNEAHPSLSIKEGAWIEPDKIRIRTAGSSGVLDLANAFLPGPHNRENMAGAALCALAAGASIQGIQSAINGFKGLAHRITHVATIDGVKFYDDSKATNVDAVIKALETFTEPVVLIMGGRDKGGFFESLKDCAGRRIKSLVVLGESSETIAGILGAVVPVDRAATMEEAVIKAGEKAKSGDIVLLSPGCASFDMFENYAKRGDAFAEAVLDRQRQRN
jgi:UDP-N-acetylmuramoylalanine--D-glutamate ligase